MTIGNHCYKIYIKVVKGVHLKSSHHKEKNFFVYLYEMMDVSKAYTVVIISPYMYIRSLCYTPETWALSHSHLNKTGKIQKQRQKQPQQDHVLKVYSIKQVPELEVALPA